MLVKIFVDTTKKINEEIFIKITNCIRVHFKCRTAEVLEAQIKRFGELGFAWKKVVIAKAGLLSAREILSRITIYRKCEVRIEDIAHELLIKLYKLKFNTATDFFSVINNVSDISVTEEEAQAIKKCLS